MGSLVKDAFLKTVLKPLFERMGTILAMWLVAKGLDGDMVATAVNAVMAALVLFVEFLWAGRKEVKLEEGKEALKILERNSWFASREGD